MGWREQFSEHCASGYFGGITLGRWLRLLRENRFTIHPAYSLRAVSTTCLSLLNSPLRHFEKRRFGEAIESTVVAPPLFVLGHWRSGTTHLQQLLAADQRFASPTLYQVFFPQTFLSTESRNSRALEFFLTRVRGFDNMRQYVQMPHEDEIAICTMSGCTCYMSIAFPRRAEFYDRFLSFRQAKDCETAL